jgi:hypothetical protein
MAAWSNCSFVAAVVLFAVTLAACASADFRKEGVGIAAAMRDIGVLAAAGVVTIGASGTQCSAALKTFRHEPQRTAPLAIFKCSSVTLKEVWHWGHRVTILLIALFLSLLTWVVLALLAIAAVTDSLHQRLSA